MRSKSKYLEEQLEKKLSEIVQDEDDPLSHSLEAAKAVVKTIEELKIHLIAHIFTSKSEEIEFFKIIKPSFLSKVIYFNELYKIELNKPNSGIKLTIKYYSAVESKVRKFFDKNREFCNYYRSGNCTLDKKYFLRRNHDLRLVVSSHFFQSDLSFTTSHDFLVAQIIANNKLLLFLEYKIRKINEPIKSTASKPGQQLKWTGTKVSLVELIYAMHATGVINNGEVSIATIAQTAERLFCINLGQFNRIFLEIKERKSVERTSFLNQLKANLEKKFVDSEK